MADVIEFYVPKDFRQKALRISWHRGKVIEFCSPLAPVTDNRAIQSNSSEANKQTSSVPSHVVIATHGVSETLHESSSSTESYFWRHFLQNLPLSPWHGACNGQVAEAMVGPQM